MNLSEICRKPRLRKLLLAFAFASIVGVVFAVGITRGHISMDDWGYIYGCPFVNGGLTANNLRRAFTEIGYDAFWMPFTYITYMCDISFFGGGWVAHHAVNVVLHVVNALLVLVFLRAVLSLAGERDGRRALTFATVAALLWAVHPMRAEAVTYIAARKELLWSFFTLVGLLAWTEHLESGRRSCYVVSLLCCLLACQSKPTAVCFPVLAYLLDALRQRRWYAGRLIRYVPFLLVSFAVGLIVLYAQANPIDHEHLNVFGESFAWRLLNACVGFGMYLWHAVALSQVHFDYRAVFGGRPLDLTLGLTVFAAVVLAVVSLLVVLRREKGTWWTLAVMSIWFFAALAPVSGIMGTVNGDHAYADRYTYLPFVGVAAAGVVLASRCTGRVLRFLAVASALALALETWHAVVVVKSFENDYTAFARTLEKDPDHWRALRVVGNEYCARAGRMDEGVRMLERSLSLRPSQTTAESLAYVLSIRGSAGDFARVRELCAGVAKAPRKDRHGMMLDALGTVSFREGRDADAVRFYTASLKADRRQYSANHTMLNLALVLANGGRRREAMTLLGRLSAKGTPEVRACCARLLLRLQSDAPTRFDWSADPFARLTERTN